MGPDNLVQQHRALANVLGVHAAAVHPDRVQPLPVLVQHFEQQTLLNRGEKDSDQSEGGR